jgi:hypothetical protein
LFLVLERQETDDLESGKNVSGIRFIALVSWPTLSAKVGLCNLLFENAKNVKKIFSTFKAIV